MRNNCVMTVTPALALTVGSSFAPAIAEVERIFIQSDPRRRAITRFLALNFGGKKPDLSPVKNAETGKRPAGQTREQILDWTRENIDAIRAGLREALHDLRSHEKIMEVGLGGKSNLPLDVMVVADLCEADAAALEVILPEIHSLLCDEPYAKAHLLLSVASFSDDPMAIESARSALRDISGILIGKELRSLPQIYLFDRYKEGVWEARDAGEVQTILGNFMLALLSGGLAQRLAHQVSPLDIEQRQAYFCGSAATALVFDVEQLQSACATRLGAEILGAEFHSKVVPDPAVVEEAAGEFGLSRANLQSWTSRLCRETFFHERGGLDLEIHFSDLCFEDAPMEDWSKIILDYEERFKAKKLPAQIDRFKENARELNEEFLEAAADFAQSLPRQARFYPGGARASQLIVERILKDIEGLSIESGESARIEEDWNARIKTALESLDRAMRALPKPPRWIFRMPAFLRKPAVQLFNLVFLYRDLKTLTNLRQNSVRLLEQKHEALMKEVVVASLTALRVGWLLALERHKKALRRLQTMLDKLQKQFEKRTVELIASPSLFRLSALDESVLAWAYYYGQRPQEGFRRALLSEHGFLEDWQKSNINIFEERLEGFCKLIYRPLSQTQLEEALRHRNGKDAKYLALSMLQGSIPLLRPNFDQTGSGSSFQLRFFQCRDPLDSSLYPVFKEDEQEWQVLASDDLLVATCCRARMMIPVSALDHLFGRENGTDSRKTA